MEGVLNEDMLGEIGELEAEAGEGADPQTQTASRAVVVSVGADGGASLDAKAEGPRIGDTLVLVSTTEARILTARVVAQSDTESKGVRCLCALRLSRPGRHTIQVTVGDASGGSPVTGGPLSFVVTSTAIADKQNSTVAFLAAAAALAGTEVSKLFPQRVAAELCQVFPSWDAKAVAAALERDKNKISEELLLKLKQPPADADSKTPATQQKTGGEDAKGKPPSTNASSAPRPEARSEISGKKTQQKKGKASKKKKKARKSGRRKPPGTPSDYIRLTRKLDLIGAARAQTATNPGESRGIPVVPETPASSLRVDTLTPSGKCLKTTCVVPPLTEFGTHLVRVEADGKASTTPYVVLAVSPVFAYANALDRLYDALFWSWEGNWHEEIENSIVALVISVEDNLKTFIKGMESMLSMLGEGSDVKQLLTTLQDNMGDALQGHDRAALGKLHQAIYQFLEVGMMPWPQGFKNAIASFERVKFKHSNRARVRTALVAVLEALEAHLPGAMAAFGQAHTYTSGLIRARERMRSSLREQDGTSIDLTLLWDLRPKPFQHMVQAMFGGAAGAKVGPPRAKVQYLPSLPLEKVISGELGALADLYSETLLGDAMMVGSLLGYNVGTDVKRDVTMIENLLRAGFGYLTTNGGKIIPVFNHRRACLDLRPAEQRLSGRLQHRRLKKRQKDVARLLRNGTIPEGKVSLRLNTAYDRAIELLGEHHSDSWVGPKLKRVWKEMFDKGAMLIFELWCGDQLIGADIGHLVGRSVYVATRFFVKSFRRMQPGFLLALAETRYLQRAGVALWDLGGTDSSPMMAYKDVVSHEYCRPEFMHIFRAIRGQALPDGGRALRPGTLIEAIGIKDLMQF